MQALQGGGGAMAAGVGNRTQDQYKRRHGSRVRKQDISRTW